MNIELDDQFKKLAHIQQIKPGKLNYTTILIGTLITIITAGIPLILYWKWLKFRNLIHHLVFQQVQNDSDKITHYLVVDSKKYKGRQRSTSYRNCIVSPFLIQKQSVPNPFNRNQNLEQVLCKYIEHKNLKYVIKNNQLHSLKYKPHKDFAEHLENGLNQQEILQSINIYGKSQGFSISFYQVLGKILKMKKLRITFELFAIKKIIFGLMGSQEQQNSALVSVIILFEIILAFLMIIVLSILGSRKHNELHEQIQNNTKYSVVRQGQIKEVKLTQLYVGDVVIPHKNQVIYFKGILAISKQYQHTPYMVVNEKYYNRIDKPLLKNPIFNHLNQVSQLNTINPGTLIMNMDFKRHLQTSQNQNNIIDSNLIQTQNNIFFYIIVTDNNFLQKFYKSYQQPDYFDNIQSVRHNFDFRQLLFQSVFFLISLSGVVIVSFGQKSKQNWIQVLLSLIVLCFPFNLLLFTTFTEMLSTIRLTKGNIHVINPSIQQIGISDRIFLQLGSFQQVQYAGYIKKQRITRTVVPQKFKSSEELFYIFRRAREQSIFSFLAWSGVMNLPLLKSEPILEKIFKENDFYIKEGGQFDQFDKIRNRDDSAILIIWREKQRYQISQKFIKSVIVQDCNTKPKEYFLILEGQYTCDDCDDYFDEVVEQNGQDQYRQIMKKLYSQGKKIKYISLRRFNIKERNFNIENKKREEVQKKLLFGGFVVFDYWPSQSAMNVLLEIDGISSSHQSEEGIKTFIFSIRQQNALLGYDHVIKNSHIFYQQKSTQRTVEILSEKYDSQGIIHIGNGILDRGSLMAADISINKYSQSSIPSDFQICQPQDVKSLFCEAFWAAQTTILTIICLSLFNFSKIVGQLVLFYNKNQFSIETQPLSERIDRLFLIDIGALFIPLLLLNLYKPGAKLVRKQHRQFFRADLMFHVLISLIGLFSLLMIEFLDHSFSEMCNASVLNNSQKHEIFLRNHRFHQFFNSHKNHSCQGAIDFIVVSFGVLVIFVLDMETQSRKEAFYLAGIINKIYMVILWMFSIFYFHIPFKNALRSLIVIVVLVSLVWVSNFMKSRKAEQDQSTITEKQNEDEEDEDQNGEI